ncbi:12523_t:CDS:10 [Ambispora gerdemannii]|uniref:U5 small nuclear ribonucleoprotein 200 kDa helicase n=1 Tax=Ambispora gerdemannii TaxID=144530 RepID=A0A9N9AA12_9GLOM|nr:12523_t:CDS:10 [Ambispora gerdemannii]
MSLAEGSTTALRLSDVLRNASSSGKRKGKGKAVTVDFASTLLQNLDRAHQEWQETLARFSEVLQQSKSVSEPEQTIFDQEEYGNDLEYNSLPTSFYYDDFSDDDTTDTIDGEDYESSYLYAQAIDREVIFEKETFDRDWLLHQCKLHTEMSRDKKFAIEPDKLCTNIFTILRSEKEDKDIENSLVDLIGYDNVELVSILLCNRTKLVENIQSQSKYNKRDDMKAQSTLLTQPQPLLNEPRRPQYGTQVVVQSEAEIREMKQSRKKEQKKLIKQRSEEEEDTLSASILGFSPEELRRKREDQLRAAAAAAQMVPQYKGIIEQKLPHVYSSSHSGNVLSIYGTRYSLPVGTVQNEHHNHEEIIIPITKKSPPTRDEKLILLEDMDHLCKGTFRAYKSLNRIQSIVYPCAYESNENMLICAPTGAGKTDIALLTILRTLAKYCHPTPTKSSEPQKFVINKNEFKIVYVAPMKALAAEIVKKMGSRLAWLNIQVRELTAEISNTQILVTTPEKWDVVTRKSTGDVELAQKVKLLIIDEVHLLHDDRGAVLESIVARTARQVESSQTMIRVIGLSATLPNYVDVALNLMRGLYYFDAGYRPVPLEQHFLGVKGKAGTTTSNNNLNQVCWEKVLALVKAGHQVMVFVHARKETVKTAQMLRDMATMEGHIDLFDNREHPKSGLFVKDVTKSRNRELRELFSHAFGIHHAGMLRQDRVLTENMFAEGVIKVLCCTSTLAWGINLPAFAVIIKGTQIYDASKGNFVDLSILDVLQIFGRAGRPQYETHGVGYILTTQDKLSHYVSAMTQQHAIESKFIMSMVDNLNAEISLGTVTNVDEAIAWLGYTYLFVRMKKNPLNYGMDHETPINDPELLQRRKELVIIAAKKLHQNQMITFNEKSGELTAKDLGRIASNYYIGHSSIEIFNREMKEQMTTADVLAMLSLSSEFANIKSRENEHNELKMLEERSAYKIKKTSDTTAGKVNILLQSYLSKLPLEDFALVSDSSYVVQNAKRIVRALFEIALNRSWSNVTFELLDLCKAIDKKMWMYEHPLAQFGLPADIISKLKNHPHQASMEELRDMDPTELGQLVHHVRMGATISKCVDQFPMLNIKAEIAPITSNVLRVTLYITPDFVWNDRVHGTVEPWWILVVDSEDVEIYHSEYFLLSRKQLGESQKIGFTIPIQEPLSPQIYIYAVSDRWLGAEERVPIPFQDLILPEKYPRHTDLLDLQPLPVTALHDEILEEICGKRFSHFNPIQTQIFHTLYNTSHNALIGAPTGSGKTVAAELAMWWAFREKPNTKVVYIAPLKALVRERVDDWRTRLTGSMGRTLVELTGDVTPDIQTLKNADIIITTPEKWDGISRNWQNRRYVQDVSLVIIDEIHLLGGERGPILEVIVSRMNYIGSQTDKKVRIVGLSTALANARDLADWLGIDEVGLFNFRHSVRPVPLEIYIDGFPGKHYCPRMATMNKPTYAAIKTHSPDKPVIVFVSSRRQTRLTAQDLIAYCNMEAPPRSFLKISEESSQMVLSQIKDKNLKMSLAFGIGLHHAGLTESDRKIVEELFVNLKIQVLIATSTLAWGVNFPAHLVVIKGTEFYDAKSKGYVDFPITDVLQMMGRAGRPQYDTSGIARIFVHDVKKNFYKKFLNEPFPVESSLHHHLPDHFNAEIVAGTINSKEAVMEYLTWTYFFRRLQQNPSYYQLKEITHNAINTYLSKMIENALEELVLSGCIEITNDMELVPTSLGKSASFYYLQHKTMRLFRDQIKSRSSFRDLLTILSDAEEYAEIPVRHNEDIHNRDLEKDVRWPIGANKPYDNPNAKTFLLIQAHFTRAQLPISDYFTDTLSVLDQSIRVLQAMIDVAAEQGMLTTSLHIMNIVQSIKQARWPDESALLTLPGIEKHHVKPLVKQGIVSLAQLADSSDSQLVEYFNNVQELNTSDAEKISKVVKNIPIMNFEYKIHGSPKILNAGEYTLEINMNRLKPSLNHEGGRIHAPRFPKSQYEAWWIVLGDIAADELIALKRVSTRNESKGNGRRKLEDNITTRIKFTAPQTGDRHQYRIFLISDGYLGIDQQYEIELETHRPTNTL